MKADSPLICQHLKGLLEVVEEPAQLDRTDVEPATVGLEAGDVEQLLHQTSQRFRLLLENVGDLTLLVCQRTVEILLQQLGIPENHVDWRLELVRCDRHEFGFELVELRKLPLHVLKALSEPAELIGE